MSQRVEIAVRGAKMPCDHVDRVRIGTRTVGGVISHLILQCATCQRETDIPFDQTDWIVITGEAKR